MPLKAPHPPAALAAAAQTPRRCPRPGSQSSPPAPSQRRSQARSEPRLFSSHGWALPTAHRRRGTFIGLRPLRLACIADAAAKGGATLSFGSAPLAYGLLQARPTPAARRARFQSSHPAFAHRHGRPPTSTYAPQEPAPKFARGRWNRTARDWDWGPCQGDFALASIDFLVRRPLRRITSQRSLRGARRSCAEGGVMALRGADLCLCTAGRVVCGGAGWEQRQAGQLFRGHRHPQARRCVRAPAALGPRLPPAWVHSPHGPTPLP